MVRGPEDLLAHASLASPARLSHPRRVDRCSHSSFREHTLCRGPCDPTKRPIAFDKYLEQVNREERELAGRLAFCQHPAPHESRDTSTPYAISQSTAWAGGQPHQDCHRPDAARIGDIPPLPAATPEVARLRQTYQVLPAVRSGRIIDVLI